MTTGTAAGRQLAARDISPVAAALAAVAALAAAVALRVWAAGPAGAASVPAGATFGLLLLGSAAAIGWRARRPTRRDLAVGTAAAAVLCLAPALRLATGSAASVTRGSGFATWAVVVTLVAVAEEALLRGVLLDAVRAAAGAPAGVVVSALAFAALHVPLYGWHVVPLDLAVGVLLGGVRLAADTVAAPACAHALADLAGWWLR